MRNPHVYARSWRLLGHIQVIDSHCTSFAREDHLKAGSSCGSSRTRLTISPPTRISCALSIVTYRTSCRGIATLLAHQPSRSHTRSSSQRSSNTKGNEGHGRVGLTSVGPRLLYGRRIWYTRTNTIIITPKERKLEQALAIVGQVCEAVE